MTQDVGVSECVVLELVPLRGENDLKPCPQNQDSDSFALGALFKFPNSNSIILTWKFPLKIFFKTTQRMVILWPKQ